MGGIIGGRGHVRLGTTAGTAAAADNPALVGVDGETFDPADQPNGTESVYGLQNGGGVKFTPDQLAGDPVTDWHGHARNLLRDYSAFYGTPPGFSSSTTGALFGREPFSIWAGGTGAAVSQQGPTIFASGIAGCTTGSTSSGYSGVTSTLYPVGWAASAYLDARIQAAPQNLPTAAQDFTMQIGTFGAPSSLAIDGVYFQGSYANANWQAVTKKNGVGTTTTDTGVAIAGSVLFTPFPTFRLWHDTTTDEIVFLIDDEEVARHAATNMPSGVLLYFGASIMKTAGATSRQLYVDGAKIAMAHPLTAASQYL